MNKKLIYISLVSGIILQLFNFSCQRNNFSKEIASVDSLYAEVNTVIADLERIDSSKIVGYTPLVKEDMNWLKENISVENANEAKLFAFKVKTAYKLSLTFSYDYFKAKKELNYCKDQLQNLRTDLVNASISQEEASKYLSDERKAFGSIKKHTDTMIERVEKLADYPEVRKEFYLKVQN